MQCCCTHHNALTGMQTHSVQSGSRNKTATCGLQIQSPQPTLHHTAVTLYNIVQCHTMLHNII